MVILRRFPLLVLALICAIVAPAAVASPSDVIEDYTRNNTRILECHPREDYEAALRAPADAAYADLPGAIEDALNTPALVGTAERPCPAAATGSDDSSTATIAMVAVPAALLLLIGGVVVARRGRRGTGGGTGSGE